MNRKDERSDRSPASKAVLVVFTVMCFVGVTFGAQQSPSKINAPGATVQQAEQAGAPSGPSSAGPEALHLIQDRSLVITSPVQIMRVSLANPNICDAIVVSPREILLNGKKAGATSLVIWGQSGQMQTFDVYVDLDVLELSNDIRSTFPNVPVKVQVSKNLVTLSGHVSSPEVADKILELAQSMVPKKQDVVSLLEVPAPPTGEVLLKVRFAEIDRSALKTFGANLISIPPAKNVGAISTQQYSPPGLRNGSIGSLGDTGGSGQGISLQNLLNVFYYRPDINLAATIEALRTQNLLQILAEPNVLTQSGKKASFLAGGEFPFPVIQSASTGFPTVTIQFHDFGVRLDFTPTITQDGYIHLLVKPEVSSLDFSNALVIEGFTVPAISTRRVQSEMDLRDGQSFVIAGLMDNRVTKQMSKIPGLGDIPLLGKIFQSYNINKSKSELLVFVTPQIVHPLPPGQVPNGPKFPERFMPPAQGPKTGASGH
jgi:pilus assembly protein CpaC